MSVCIQNSTAPFGHPTLQTLMTTLKRTGESQVCKVKTHEKELAQRFIQAAVVLTSLPSFNSFWKHRKIEMGLLPRTRGRVNPSHSATRDQPNAQKRSRPQERTPKSEILRARTPVQNTSKLSNLQKTLTLSNISIQ